MLKGHKNIISIKECFDLFLSDYIIRYGSNEQYPQLESLGRLFIIPQIGKIQCKDITIEDWQSIINNARPVPRKRKDGSEFSKCTTLSKKYLSNIKACITCFNGWGAARNYFAYIPPKQLYIPASAPTVGKNILQLSDIERFFSDPTGLWYERAYMFEILTGLRPGEVLGLRWTNYNPVTGIIIVNQSVNARKRITTGKNSNAHRAIMLTAEVQKLIESQKQSTNQLHSEYIFCNPEGRIASQAGYRKCWKAIVKKKDLPSDTSPYSLRHTFYTHTEGRLPDRVIKTIFGHSPQTDSHRIYGNHLLEGELHEAAEILSTTPLYMVSIQKKL